MNKDHVEESLNKIRAIFEDTSAEIENLQVGEKIPATKLAEKIAAKYEMTGPNLYFTLKFLFKDYPNVKITKGAHGGIEKLAVKQTKADSECKES